MREGRAAPGAAAGAVSAEPQTAAARPTRRGARARDVPGRSRLPAPGGNEYQVKRCEIIDDIVYFRADNPAGDHNWAKPKRMDNKRHPIQVIDRVRWIGSWEGER
jgi:hypothetical protein